MWQEINAREAGRRMGGILKAEGVPKETLERVVEELRSVGEVPPYEAK